MSRVRVSERAAFAYLSLTNISPFEAAGLRKVAFARSTGTLVSVYDSAEAGIDTWGWTSMCETHGRLIIHETRALAESFASAPEAWCGVCAGTEEPDAS